ncbi:MAG: FliG C-terminal domain-containing protein [Bacteroidota bacterium]
MKIICFYFQVHQPFRLRRYRFFDIGNDHNYFDDYRNRYIMKRIAQKCYLPTNQILYDLIKEYGSRFKVSFSLSGTVMDQFETFAPEVLESFKRLADTGCVEFLAETYSHSLSALKSRTEFELQVKAQTEKVKQHFGQEPTSFRNTELIYSDSIGEMVADMGFKAMLTEGAKHVLGWKSPNYLYCNAINPKLKLLLKNYQLSDDIAFRFSQQSWGDWPLTTEKYVDWLNQIDSREEVVNLFMDYETFGEHQWPETGIFEFLKALPNRVFNNSDFQFCTPSEVANKLQPVSPLHVPHPISWADEERDLTAWLGNELQDEAFDSLYSLRERVRHCNNTDLQRDWKYLQTSDHFYYMCTKWFADGDVHKYFNPYDTPYEAFINFMNVLSDFIIRLERCEGYTKPVDIETEKLTESKKETKKVSEKDSKNQKSKKTKIPAKPIAKAKSKKSTSLKKIHVEFENLDQISDVLAKKILKKISPDVLALAIKDASAALKNKFLHNLGKRASESLEKRMHVFVKSGKAEISKCRNTLIRLANKEAK